LALSPGNFVRSLAVVFWGKFPGACVLAGSAAAAMVDGHESGKPAARRRILVQIGLMFLACALLLGRPLTAGSLAAGETAAAAEAADRATVPVQASCDPLSGAVRVHGGWILRWGKATRLSFATGHWDDPYDDETSDDPTDDDDGWEGLNALGETEVPVPAWFQEGGCFHSDLEAQSDLFWYEPFHFTSFLTLQRLRC